MTSTSSSGSSSSIPSSTNLYTVRNAFRELRKRNDDGKLTLNDLGQNITANDRNLFAAADKDGDGRLKFGEWRDLKVAGTVQDVARYISSDANIANKKTAIQINIPAQDFQALATQGDQQASGINATDLNINISTKRADRIVNRFDKDNNGEISRQEFDGSRKSMQGVMTHQRLAKLFANGTTPSNNTPS